MIRYVAVTLAALYIIGVTQGDAPPRGEVQVTRASTEGMEFSFAALIGAAEASGKTMGPRLSHEEAVALAVAAGQKLRADRPTAVLLGSTEAALAQPQVATDASADAVASADWRVVTGDNVNLRAGPGTGNDVVASLSLGTRAEFLGSDGNWHRIRTSDGAVEGWIYAKYLGEDA